MKMHCISGGRLRMRKSVYLPEVDRSETIEAPCCCFLVRHPQGNVLFDTGCHPSAAEDPVARWGHWSKVTAPLMPPGENVIAGLASIGVTPDDIDVVVCSHLHYDHCGCNAFFKRAGVIVHQKEIEAARAADAGSMGYIATEWDFGTFDEMTAERDLFGDSRIVLLPLPGHTLGSIGALVSLEQHRFLLASDAVPLRVVLDRNVAPRNTRDPETMLKTWEEIRRIEAGGATILCGHDAAQWDTLRKGADFYD